MRSALAALCEDHAASHRDPVNVRVHEVAAPAIVFHVVAILDRVDLGAVVAALLIGDRRIGSSGPAVSSARTRRS